MRLKKNIYLCTQIFKDMKRHSAFLTFAICCAFSCMAQMQAPVKFSVQQKKVSDNTLEVEFVGKVDAGWHVYGTDIADGGPTRAELTLEKTVGLTPDGKLRATGNVHRAVDDLFEMEVSYMEGTAKFSQKFIITEPKYEVAGYLTYGACNDQNCMPPTNVEFQFEGTGIPEKEKAPAKEEKAEETVVEELPAPVDTVQSEDQVIDTAAVETELSNDLWAPVID